MRSGRRRATAVAALGLALGLAGCGADGDDSATAGDETPEVESDDADADAGDTDADAAAAGAAGLTVAATDLGEIVADAEGRSLYLFDPDEQGEPTCYDDCAASWPPLTVEGEPAAGDDVDPALVGTTERDDGTLQVTYDGWPLYYWAGDQGPGDVEGQGVQDVWWVLAPDGAPVREAEADAGGDETPEDAGAGY